MEPFITLNNLEIYQGSPVVSAQVADDYILVGCKNHLSTWDLKSGELIEEKELEDLTEVVYFQERKLIFVINKGELETFFGKNLISQVFDSKLKCNKIVISSKGQTPYFFDDQNRFCEFNHQRTGFTVRSALHRSRSEIPLPGSSLLLMTEEHFVFSIGQVLCCCNFNTPTPKFTIEIEFPSKIRSAILMKMNVLVLSGEENFFFFQIGASAPYFESQSLGFQIEKISKCFDNYFSVIGKKGEVQIWDFPSRRCCRAIDPIENLLSFQLLSFTQALVGYTGEEKKVELRDMLIHDEEPIVNSSSYSKGLLLNQMREGFTEEFFETNTFSEFFRGYYHHDIRHGPAVIIRNFMKIICLYHENVIVGPITVIDLSKNRRSIIGIAKNFIDSLDDIEISHILENNFKIESLNKQKQITSFGFTGYGKMTFANGYVIEACIEENRLSTTQTMPLISMVRPDETSPLSIMTVETQSRFTDSRLVVYEIDYEKGIVIESDENKADEEIPEI